MSRKVYGHVVASDVFGRGYVVPIGDSFEDIKNRLYAHSVSLFIDFAERYQPHSGYSSTTLASSVSGVQSSEYYTGLNANRLARHPSFSGHGFSSRSSITRYGFSFRGSGEEQNVKYRDSAAGMLNFHFLDSFWHNVLICFFLSNRQEIY